MTKPPDHLTTWQWHEAARNSEVTTLAGGTARGKKSMKQETELNIQELASAFAAEHVSSRIDLQTGQEFPMDLWRKMGQAGLFKIGIPEIYGGMDGGYIDLLKAGEAFVQSGYNLGLALSWLYQQIIAHYVLGVFGTRRQREQYLSAAAAGRITLSFAVSEPGHGSRPRLLTTEARKQDHGYMLNGEKTYLTNGPIAGIFIVVAVTDDQTPQKRFTAFMVPRTAEGVTVTKPLAMNFLKPSPHGGIKLDHCLIEKKSVVGKEGSAWRDIVVPLGEIEDVVMMGPVLGGMAAQLSLLTAAVREHLACPDAAFLGELGAQKALLQTLRIIAYESAHRLDRGSASPVPLVITFTRLATEFHAGIARIADRGNITPHDEYAYLHRDLESLVSLKKRLMQIRQEKIGAALLKN
ncbi:MAG: acyl-CoA/acyl-ACP dehydrogenase [Deltaproteobacteria bacterium]